MLIHLFNLLYNTKERAGIASVQIVIPYVNYSFSLRPLKFDFCIKTIPGEPYMPLLVLIKSYLLCIEEVKFPVTKQFTYY